MLQEKPAFKETEIYGVKEGGVQIGFEEIVVKENVANNNMLIVLLRRKWVDGARKIDNFIILGVIWSDSFSLDFIKGCRYLCFKILFQSCNLL